MINKAEIKYDLWIQNGDIMNIRYLGKAEDASAGDTGLLGSLFKVS